MIPCFPANNNTSLTIYFIYIYTDRCNCFPSKKSRQGVTIRRNKQSTSTAKSLSPYLNRTESSHSSNSKRAPNMIPYFPANIVTDSSQEDYTDEHPCGIVSNRSSTLHITEDSPPNTSQVRTRSTTKQLNHCLENQKGRYLLFT